MIVKNEALHLGNSLKAIAKYFDDIVVVDTGSTDDSKNIAKKFTDKVYDFEWISDFSAARNYSLQFAKYDWILVVDADEVINQFDVALLSELISTHPTQVGTVEIASVTNDENSEEADLIQERISRIFNKNYYEFFGIIHEQVCKKNSGKAPDGRFDTPLSFMHNGYTKEIIESKDKIARNITLLQHAIDKTGDDAYLHYQLGKSYYLGKNYEQAIKNFEISLSLQKDEREDYSEVLIECYGYCLIKTAQYEKSLDILQYEKQNPSTDFIFLKALILMNNSNFQGALDNFQQCIRMPPGRKTGVNSYKANHNIAVILECHNMLDEAVEFYKKCGNYAPAQAGITRILE
ncbi:tetratricopeptide repeat-containing glycosyltransferase family 2 protein [Pectobacterium brasiliense]|uniref:tetratricopeptide repeat-containing glycosyltransferase family 2 protein n=1 Tax=Pectobacterium brasiliense TaxID=180957 RepID=UPI002152A301|nr:glycosyltransferase [Pectobacterium brasiliense]